MPQKEDSFLTLKKQLKEKNIGNLYLFFGEETFVKDSYVNYMINLIPDDGFGDFNRVFLDGKDFDADKIDGAIDAFPVMAEKKVVIVKDSGIFKAKPALSPEMVAFWIEKLKNLPDFVIVVFDEYDVDKRSSSYKTVAKYGLSVEFCYLQPYELTAWIVREAQKNGRKISKSAAEYLLELCDPGLNNIKNELYKLFNYCEGEIFKSDIDKAVSKPMSVVIFDITDAISKGDRDTAMKTLLQLKESNSSAFGILYLLNSNFDRLLKAKLLLESGANYDFISQKLGVKYNTARKYAETSRKFSEKFLIDRICKTAEYDLKIKQGLIDEWSALIEYVAESLK
ncbi:MAG: DNA polymerase III subunit delta [Clostridia bacterium]|nr:DNA polymerase III subunit delta [Clostridia bacterium]